MRRHWLSPSASEFGPLVFQGHTYFDEIEEGFIEIVRMGKDAGGIDNLSKDKYVSLAYLAGQIIILMCLCYRC
ncbi:hypothetical protein LIPSTDRAFT_102736 [Lipomyces starkeyi NRRL Y-11557]|uniref:Uncharacterized protein n=1 Tax=Lipomyces starkeyi NRRL Y-11557 TaxID=675824 RepID=A0A1E3QE74_LIPST|nr:hypothetical protein LIPSTDRAFT_102736 [Lipomyces starkeyi NRRL Y-11557]